MPKVIFKFDKEKDLYNIWETCNFKSNWSNNFKKGIPEKIIELCENKKFDEIKKELEKYQKRIHSLELIPIIEKSFNESWNKINKEFFKRLEKIMKQPFCCKEVTGYLTSVSRCPYNFKKENASFFVPIFKGIPGAMHIAAHELIHIQFHNTYWKQVEEKIGEEKTADLKEALTVLLNLEFKDLWIVPDKGYAPHEKLRKFITQQWKKKKDFEVLLDKCVDYLK